MLDEQVKKQIRLEIEMIERLFAAYQPLFELVATTTPSLVESTACASVLHSFYNGLEKIFQIINKRVDAQPLAADRWHQALLEQMMVATSERPAVLSPETGAMLKDYVAFRHFHRHSYSMLIDWKLVSTLAVPLPSVWSQVRAELEAFIDEGGTG